MGQEFDDVLNDCLERMAMGEPIDQCVARYQEHERELLPLLTTGAILMRTASATSYWPEAKVRGLDRLAQALAEKSARGSRPVPGVFRRLVARPLFVGFAAVLLVVIAAGGTTMASSNSVPGDSLYWLKQTKENVSLKLPGSDIRRAQRHARLASVRGQELRQLIARGQFGEAEELNRRIGYHLNQSASHAGVPLAANPVEMPVSARWSPTTPNAVKLSARLERDGKTLRAELLELIRNLPPDQRNRIRQLMHQSELGYRILIGGLNQRGTPGRLPFWNVEPLGTGLH